MVSIDDINVLLMVGHGGVQNNKRSTVIVVTISNESKRLLHCGN
jgi:hypothetical protein